MFLQVSESQLFVPIGILIVPMYHIQSVASGGSAPPPPPRIWKTIYTSDIQGRR